MKKYKIKNNIISVLKHTSNAKSQKRQDMLKEIMSKHEVSVKEKLITFLDNKLPNTGSADYFAMNIGVNTSVAVESELDLYELKSISGTEIQIQLNNLKSRYTKPIKKFIRKLSSANSNPKVDEIEDIIHLISVYNLSNEFKQIIDSNLFKSKEKFRKNFIIKFFSKIESDLMRCEMQKSSTLKDSVTGETVSYFDTFGLDRDIKFLSKNKENTINFVLDELIKSCDDILLLEVALEIGSEFIVSYLLENGVDANCKNKNESSAIMFALNRDSENVIEDTEEKTITLINLLINHGAELNCCNKFNLSSLHLAVDKGFVNIAKDIIYAGADVNLKETDTNTTPLIRSVFEDNSEIARLLLDNGADIHITNSKGESALDLAKFYNLNELVSMLESEELNDVISNVIPLNKRKRNRI